jgi:hypothetical protein
MVNCYWCNGTGINQHYQGIWGGINPPPCPRCNGGTMLNDDGTPVLKITTSDNLHFNKYTAQDVDTRYFDFLENPTLESFAAIRELNPDKCSEAEKLADKFIANLVLPEYKDKLLARMLFIHGFMFGFNEAQK